MALHHAGAEGGVASSADLVSRQLTEYRAALLVLVGGLLGVLGICTMPALQGWAAARGATHRPEGFPGQCPYISYNEKAKMTRVTCVGPGVPGLF